MRVAKILLLLLFPLFGLGQNTILWKVTSPRSQKVSYLLGTYHIMGNSFVDSLSIIKEKLDASELVAFETQLDREKIAAAYNARPGSDEINKILSKEDIALINKMNGPSRVDITKFTPGELFVKMQAYYPLAKCGLANPADTWQRMDEYLIQLAKKGQKKIHYFESDSLQMQEIAAFTSVINWKFFKSAIGPLLDKYKSADVDQKMCQLTVQYKTMTLDYRFTAECQSDVLLKNRNDKWMKELPGLLDNNNCFIAVGLMHYYNKCGLIEQLRKLGYVVEPVTILRRE
jgi:uncharacterized protein